MDQDKKSLGNMEGQGKPCYYCNEPVDHLAGNPGKWPVVLPQNQKPEYHHMSCVKSKLEQNESLRTANAELVDFLKNIKENVSRAKAIGAQKKFNQALIKEIETALTKNKI